MKSYTPTSLSLTHPLLSTTFPTPLYSDWNVTNNEASWQNDSTTTEGEITTTTNFTTVLLVLVLFVIIVGTIIGNILVCVAVCLVRKLRRPYNYLLVSLAVSDLCVAILVMPMALLHELLGEWQFGRVACDIWVSFDVLSCTASILNLCMISVDRYLAITKPLEYGVKRTPTRMIAYIVFVWISSAFISVPPVLILGNEHGDGSMCTVCQNFWYQIYATFGSFYIPLTVMVTVYYKIFQAAKRIVNEEKKAQAHLKNDQQKSNLRPPLTKTNNSTQKKMTSRSSIVQINNGEVETKLVSQHLSTNSLTAHWVSNSPNNASETPRSHNNLQLQEPSFVANSHKQTNHLLEVPLGENPHGNVSPASTTTTCESSWSLIQTKDNQLTPTSPHKDSLSSINNSDPDFAKNLSNLTLININPESINTFNNQSPYRGTAFNINSTSDLDEKQRLFQELDEKKQVPKDDLMAFENKHITSTIDMGNASDTSSMGLVTKCPKETHSRRKSSGGSHKKKLIPKSKLRLTLAKERKASTTLGIIMSAFIVCWLPFFVLALVRPFDPTAIPNYVSSLFLWLGYANSLLNPIIYATLNKDFRKPFQEILCLRCSSLNLLMREEFYHSQYGPDTPNHSNVRASNPQRDSWDPPPCTDSKNRKNTLTESRF